VNLQTGDTGDVRPVASQPVYAEMSGSQRTRWIRARREPRPDFDVNRPQHQFLELERSPEGELLPTLTVLLRGRECTWHCLMCDLWKNTVPRPIPPGAVPAQLQHAIASIPPQPSPPRQIKLYNSGSFLDVRAVPPQDYSAIGRLLRGFQRVIVECHPKLVGPRALQFRDHLPSSAQLEIAMGLETVHPVALERLNKGMTLADFRRAAEFLCQSQIALRTFALVSPPFVPASETLPWVKRSATFAFDSGATAVSLIPTRPGNGAMDTLARHGHFTPPTLDILEDSLDQCLALARGRVFADLWDLEQFSTCPNCFPLRRARLEATNLHQVLQPRIPCSSCGANQARTRG
jgi:radical SAM enzyme (TIGR01210 family)